MKKKLVLKPFVLPTFYISLLLLLMLYTASSLYREKPKEEKEFSNSNIMIEENEIVPVIEEVDTFVLNPYLGENVEEQVGYYDYKGEKDTQEKSIIQFGNTYLQNTGITYSSDKDFQVVSVMDGKVTKVYENDLLGNVIEVTHDNIICVYQMVKDVTVKVGDEVKSGNTIATSGTSKLINEGSNLHFEVIKDGKIENPKSIIGINTKEL